MACCGQTLCLRCMKRIDGCCAFCRSPPPTNHTEAVAWLRKRVETGDLAANSVLGSHYRTGQGVEKDAREAVRLYRFAAEGGISMPLGDLSDDEQQAMAQMLMRKHLGKSLPAAGLAKGKAPTVSSEPRRSTEDAKPVQQAKRCAVCAAAAELRCSRCKKVWYCGSEHQRAAWKDGHRNQCQSEKMTI